MYISVPADDRQVGEGPIELCVATRGTVEESVQVLVETGNTGSALGVH